MASDTRSSRPVLNATRARQGRSGTRIFWVLVFGVLLTVLAFTAAYLWKAGDLKSANSNNPTASSVTKPVFSAPEPAPINTPPAEPATPAEPTPAGR